MKISVTKAAKEWSISRTTIYQKINDGELSRTSDKKIDTSEMLRVFGEPVSKKRTEQSVNTTHKTCFNSQGVQERSELKHQLELEKLKNEHLRQQVSAQKDLIENYQKQIDQLQNNLEKANASIHDFTQIRLLEFKRFEILNEPRSEQNDNTLTANSSTTEKKKKWWVFGKL
ncbi:plasmid replication DNA-binding protein [Psychrobacter urativorans]|uniref:plasmid replication DNA-binding protein n=1 Tax=Psychrobacter urativorans TaxID=45610 RepID=UPI000A5FBC7D|nr:plasmid replication DNA-binding protein [Psychrobacter urativorans]